MGIFTRVFQFTSSSSTCCFVDSLDQASIQLLDKVITGRVIRLDGGREHIDSHDFDNDCNSTTTTCSSIRLSFNRLTRFIRRIIIIKQQRVTLQQVNTSTAWEQFKQGSIFNGQQHGCCNNVDQSINPSTLCRCQRHPSTQQQLELACTV